jgi:very-short-patch-repair endonuclease
MPPYRKLANHNNTPEDIRRARALRKDASNAERILWNELRQLPKDLGFRFRRQYPIHPYIVDFACVRLRLAVEIDGESHDTRLNYDAARDDRLKRGGFTILRFTNNDVYEACEGVVMKILDAAKRLKEKPLA